MPKSHTHTHTQKTCFKAHISQSKQPKRILGHNQLNQELLECFGQSFELFNRLKHIPSYSC